MKASPRGRTKAGPREEGTKSGKLCGSRQNLHKFTNLNLQQPQQKPQQLEEPKGNCRGQNPVESQRHQFPQLILVRVGEPDSRGSNRISRQLSLLRKDPVSLHVVFHKKDSHLFSALASLHYRSLTRQIALEATLPGPNLEQKQQKAEKSVNAKVEKLWR